MGESIYRALVRNIMSLVAAMLPKDTCCGIRPLCISNMAAIPVPSSLNSKYQ